jgi:hypothetical protein
MKYLACLLILITSQCVACELVDGATLRKDVEAAFVAKSFAAIINTYGSSSSVSLELGNDYDEDHPTKTLHFKNLSALSVWFHEQHEYTEHMFIPETVRCSVLSCKYEVPEVTLHHGVYLAGFKGHVVGTCTTLVQVSIFWG